MKKYVKEFNQFHNETKLNESFEDVSKYIKNLVVSLSLLTGTALAQDQVETVKTNYAILSDCSKGISPYELAHKIGVKSLLKPEPNFVDLLKHPEYRSYISGQQLAGQTDIKQKGIRRTMINPSYDDETN